MGADWASNATQKSRILGSGIISPAYRLFGGYLSKNAIWISSISAAVVIAAVAVWYFFLSGPSLVGSWKIVSDGIDKGDHGSATFRSDKTLSMTVDFPLPNGEYVRLTSIGVWNYEGDVLNVSLMQSEYEYLGEDNEVRKIVANFTPDDTLGLGQEVGHLMSGRLFWEGNNKFMTSARDDVQFAPVFERQ